MDPRRGQFFAAAAAAQPNGPFLGFSFQGPYIWFRPMGSASIERTRAQERSRLSEPWESEVFHSRHPFNTRWQPCRWRAYISCWASSRDDALDMAFRIITGTFTRPGWAPGYGSHTRLI